MSVYEASRFGGGNALFPATIKLGKDEVTFKVSGLFDGKEKSLPYRQITSIEINGGALSMCEIVIRTSRSGRIVAPGFSHSKAKEIQSALTRKIESVEKSSTNSSISNSKDPRVNNTYDVAEVIESTEKALNNVYSTEFNDIKRYYYLKIQSESGDLNAEEQEEFKILKMLTDNGTPSVGFRMELEEKGIDLGELLKSNQSYTQFLDSRKKGILSENNISNEQIFSFLKKYWKYLLIGFICFMGLIIYLKSREKNTAETAQILHQQLESKSIAIEKLLLEEKYNEALDIAETLNHPDHIIFDAKSEILNSVYYDTYWTNYKDSIVKVILNKMKK
ncbi:MAG: hypothetical protein ACK5H3_03365 [Flavobacteriia bacterium]|jgi:hypothetical protein